MSKYQATAELHAWAIPNRYRLDDNDPEFHIVVMKGDSKPYNDGAFMVGERLIEWDVTIPDNHVEQQIDSLKEDVKKEHEDHARRVLQLYEQIGELQALPAPE